MITRPRPWVAAQPAARAGPGALSKISSQSPGRAASTPWTWATGSPAASRSRAPSWAARSPNPAASAPSGFPLPAARLCRAHQGPGRCIPGRHWSSLLLPGRSEPPLAGPATRAGVSRASRSASSSSRPTRNTGRAISRTAWLATAAAPPAPGQGLAPDLAGQLGELQVGHIMVELVNQQGSVNRPGIRRTMISCTR